MAKKRMSPKERAAARADSLLDARMTRADTLASLQKHGRVVPLSQQRKMAAKEKKKADTPWQKLLKALGGK